MCKKFNMTVNDAAKLTGTTIRTLHYYDQIGLLHPSRITKSRYRIYDENDMTKFQNIQFLKEIGFSLKEIVGIISDPNYDQRKALYKHRKILLAKRERIDELIELIDKTITGKSNLDFSVLNGNSVLVLQQQYYQEVKGNWQKYKEFKEFESTYNSLDSKGKAVKWNELLQKASYIFESISTYMNREPSDQDVQKLIGRWRDFISNNYYKCSNDMLLNLGNMYITDKRFSKSIDSYGKQGLSEFVNEAIKYYCKSHK